MGSYYPFGLKQKGYNYSIQGGNSLAQQWKFAGKELSEDLGLDSYDFGARNYDASLGRWFGVDNLAEVYHTFSPYHYSANNPILFVDLDGNGFADAHRFISGGSNGVSQTKDPVDAEKKDEENEEKNKNENQQNDQIINQEYETVHANDSSNSSPDDIIFKNKNGDEIGRIIMPGKDKIVIVPTESKLPTPIKIDLTEIDPKTDAVGVNFEISTAIGGGMHGGLGYVYFLNGGNSGELYTYGFHGGNVGVGGGIGVAAYTSFFNEGKARNEFFNVKGFSGNYNGYSASIFFEGGITWSNEGGVRNELYPGHHHTRTWKSVTIGGSLGPQYDARYLMGKTYSFTKINTD